MEQGKGVDLETWGGEGGVNVRFVNNFLDGRQGGAAERLNHYARALGSERSKLFISVFSSLPSFLA